MKQILFVDDDRSMLEALRTRLHRMHGDWQMIFANNGEQAIAELERKPIDVIVTDMRMPGMDGAELLTLVSARWPEVVRMVLSGYAEMQQTVRLVPVAHQYLSKPCEPSRLENAIERSVRLHDLLRQPQLRASVGRIRKLPALPRTYAKLQEVLTDDNCSVAAVAKIIAADTAIAARVLQIVNSAFFRLARRITNVEQAVAYLGFTPVRNLVLSAEIFGELKADARMRSLDLERMQSHVLRVANATQALTARTAIADDALLAALVHDIGYWVLAQECADDLAESLDVAREKSIPLHEAEREVIGASHAEIGAYLLGLWGLPYPVIEAVAYHHRPQDVSQTEFDVLAALSIAHSLAEPTEAQAFSGELPEDAKVGSAYLGTLKAPFTWEEATRRVSESLENGAADA